MKKMIAAETIGKSPLSGEPKQEEWVVSNEYMHRVQVDAERLENYRNRGNQEKVLEYQNMLVSHVKEMIRNSVKRG